MCRSCRRVVDVIECNIHEIELPNRTLGRAFIVDQFNCFALHQLATLRSFRELVVEFGADIRTADAVPCADHWIAAVVLSVASIIDLCQLDFDCDGQYPNHGAFASRDDIQSGGCQRQ